MDELNYVGNESQLYSVEEVTLHNGKREGTRLLIVKNKVGLEMRINLDRCFDICGLSLKSTNLCYISPNNIVNSKYYDNKGLGFLKSFTAGFLTTCGLTQVGSPNNDLGEDLPLHGTISNTPVDHYLYEITNEAIILKGIILDEGIFSHKLKLIRVITISLNENIFTIKDLVENRGDEKTPLEILYHMNLGYPLLDENLILEIPSSEVNFRDKEAEKYRNYLEVENPQKGFVERCYYHYFSTDLISVKAYNPKIKKGVKISYDKTQLPFFTERKLNGVRDYVLGLEPGNCLPDGRNVMREKGLLSYIDSKEIKEFELKIELLEE
ncbi:MAG: DUF4432 family protein [Candidatus Onthovivens sp.]|nr:DUF4432 family protein [Candidatus Onthovivens sp.]